MSDFKTEKGGTRAQSACYRIDGTSRSWRPTPLIGASFFAHAGALAAALIKPGLFPWAIATLVANHLILGVEGLFPKSRLLGPNLSRLPDSAREDGFVALTFDDGPDPEVTPRVLDLLDRYQVTASFFCIGVRVAQYPDLSREIVLRGHALENHSYHHPHGFAFLGPAAIRRELVEAQVGLSRISGCQPRFFRAVAGVRTPLLEPVLCRLGLRLVSWTRRGLDTLDQNPRRVAARLTKGLRAGDILLAHDGNSARTRSSESVVLESLPRVLDSVAGMGLRTARLDTLILDE